jgi:glycosyltransferase involved in cell wall biosynthesis
LCKAHDPNLGEAKTMSTHQVNAEIAILIPCYNEAATIGKVVADFRAALPSALIYVYDNNSADGTQEEARAAGAIVRSEALQGKGNVVRRMFADVEADIYVLVDGDDTYEAARVSMLVDTLSLEQLDMVNAARETQSDAAYRWGHRFGNVMLTGIVSLIFGNQFHDMLSGYRVLSRRFVKSFPALTSGFEIETELTIHALHLRMPVREVQTAYKERPPGSTSKLRSVRDGLRILKTILVLVKDERPLPFFTIIFVLLAVTAVILAIPIVMTFIETGLVPRFPTAILATGLMLSAFLSFACGLILETVTRGRLESKRMRYLSIPVTRNTSSEPRRHE